MNPTMTLAQIRDALHSHANVWKQLHNGLGGTSFDNLADAIDAHLAERDVEVLQEWKSLLANLASVVRVQNGNLHEDINKLLAHADALLARPSKAQDSDAAFQVGVGVDVSSDGVAVTFMRSIGDLRTIIYQELHPLPAPFARPSKSPLDPMQELADQAQELSMGYGKAQDDCDICHEPLADECACQNEFRREHDSGAAR